MILTFDHTGPTFIRIYKKKTTEGFQSIPYVAAIFSCMLWIYYALLKGNDVLLITINTVGVVIETIYIVMYITYAPKPAKMFTLKLLLFLNFGAFSAIVLLCHYLIKGEARLQVFGWICVAFSISVFAAPLSVMLPNVVGFLFGMAQMILYGIYRKYDKKAEKHKLPEKQPQFPSPVKKENINNIDSHSLCKNDGIMMPPQHAQEAVIELGHRDYQTQEGKFHGPHQAQPCFVDADEMNSGGLGPATTAQLVQCAV
ncbi:hypothetical protein Cgig2_005565 [Carnegiea gigantea]|uniref:Bidirectional sugar transporter SWEET n=1 Tax=Carnegiea gigantea TaxID=171969 RepID=A0A9Q1KU16_9CARY|nr:hypothetical protein Cgig2_005565 [Carnegiea gigantea]